MHKVFNVDNPQDEESKDEVSPFKRMEMADTKIENLSKQIESNLERKIVKLQSIIDFNMR